MVGEYTIEQHKMVFFETDLKIKFISNENKSIHRRIKEKFSRTVYTGGNVKDVAEELGTRAELLSKWLPINTESFGSVDCIIWSNQIDIRCRGMIFNNICKHCYF